MALPNPPVASESLDPPWGVNVAGFLRSEMGIGEAARGVIMALDDADVPLVPVHGSYVPGNRQGHEFVCVRPGAASFAINLICINPEELPIFLQDAGPSFVADRYTIGFWWWEVAAFPERWLPTFDLVDELWVGTEHVAHNLRAVSTVPVRKMRIPIAAPAASPLDRKQLGLPPGFVFLFVFDFNSIFERKNPLAVVRAFTQAFQPNVGAALVIKSINHAADLASYANLCAAAAEHPDVHLIGRYMSVEEKNALIAACDCYVSLHRAEGFALTAAEAMRLGKPVVATRYSGNLEFMNDENSFLVDYAMVPICVDNPLYPPGGMWADPDCAHAAALMREVFDAPDEARRRAALGARLLREEFSPEVTGTAMEARLREIHGALHSASPSRPADARPSRWRVTQGKWTALSRRVSVRAAARALRDAKGQRHAVAGAILQEFLDVVHEWRTHPWEGGVRTVDGASALDSPELYTWEILAQLRRQEAEMAALRSQVAALKPHIPRSDD